MKREAYRYVERSDRAAWEARGWAIVNDMGAHLPAGIIMRADSEDARREAERG